MKIAISTQGTDLATQVDPRFGRCQYFIIADPETMQFEALENTNMMASGGAGIATAQMIAGKGVQVVLIGNCGPNAYQTLSAAGVQVITGVSGSAKEAIELYRAGQLQATSQPTVDAHFGMGSGSGIGMGGGMGRGMGMGGGMGRGMGGAMGRGMGRGIARGTGMGKANPGAEWSPMPATGPLPQSMSPEQKLETLRSQAQLIRHQMDDILRQIDELEEKTDRKISCTHL